MASVGGQKGGRGQWDEVYEGQEAGLGGDGESPEGGTFEQSLEHCAGVICMSCFLKKDCRQSGSWTSLSSEDSRTFLETRQ